MAEGEAHAGHLSRHFARQPRTKLASVHVARHGGHWSDPLEDRQDLGIDDVAGVDDVDDARKELEDHGIEVAVIVADHADADTVGRRIGLVCLSGRTRGARGVATCPRAGLAARGRRPWWWRDAAARGAGGDAPAAGSRFSPARRWSTNDASAGTAAGPLTTGLISPRPSPVDRRCAPARLPNRFALRRGRGGCMRSRPR